MLYRYHIETMVRADEEATSERLRELGLESWELISVLPGSRTDPDDRERMTFFLKRDASSDIGL